MIGRGAVAVGVVGAGAVMVFVVGLDEQAARIPGAVYPIPDRERCGR